MITMYEKAANPESQTEVRPDLAWEERAKLLRVISHPVRLAILAALCERPHCVKHINALIDIPQPHLSQHMAALRKAKLVDSHVCGPVRCYYILRPTLVRQLIDLLEQDHEVVPRKSDSVVEEAREGWQAMTENV